MTKKLSLAALALVSACYFTACDDDSSSVIAPVDETNSSASVASSESKADPESSTTAPKSSASEEAKEETPESSSSVESSEDNANLESSSSVESSEDKADQESSSSEENPEIIGPCDIDFNSNTWEFEAVGKFMTFDGSAKVTTVFEGSTATITMNMSAEFGEFCAVAKKSLDDKIASEVEKNGEQGTVNVECDENGELTMSAVKTENNVTEESKKKHYDETVQVCKNAQNGDLTSIFIGSAGEDDAEGDEQ